MMNSKATFESLMEELEAEFSDLEELFGEDDDEEINEGEAATTVVGLIEQAQTVVSHVLDNSVDGDSDSDNQGKSKAIGSRLASIENSLADIDAQLEETRHELAILRQLLANT